MPGFITNYLDKNVHVTPGQYGSPFWALVYILLVFGGVSLAVVCMNWLERIFSRTCRSASAPCAWVRTVCCSPLPMPSS